MCIILVVIGHYSPEYSPDWWLKIRSLIYSFHMPLFMFVSGYVYLMFRREGEGHGRFLWKKVRRLMVPYAVVSVLIITIKLLTQGSAYVENPVTLMSYARMFFMPEAGYFLWFIWALWWMFVIAPWFGSPKARAGLLAVSVLLHFFAPPLPEVFALREACAMMVYFVSGMVTVDLLARREELRRLVRGWMMPVSVVVFALLYALHAHGLLVAFAGIWMVLAVSRFVVEHGHSGCGWLYATASASYIVYLLHTTFEGFAKSAIRKIPAMLDGSDTAMFILGALIVIACGTSIPVLLHRFVLRRYKITRVAFGL